MLTMIIIINNQSIHMFRKKTYAEMMGEMEKMICFKLNLAGDGRIPGCYVFKKPN